MQLHALISNVLFIAPPLFFTAHFKLTELSHWATMSVCIELSSPLHCRAWTWICLTRWPHRWPRTRHWRSWSWEVTASPSIRMLSCSPSTSCWVLQGAAHWLKCALGSLHGGETATSRVSVHDSCIVWQRRQALLNFFHCISHGPIMPLCIKDGGTHMCLLPLGVMMQTMFTNRYNYHVSWSLPWCSLKC